MGVIGLLVWVSALCNWLRIVCSTRWCMFHRVQSSSLQRCLSCELCADQIALDGAYLWSITIALVLRGCSYGTVYSVSATCLVVASVASYGTRRIDRGAYTQLASGFIYTGTIRCGGH